MDTSFLNKWHTAIKGCRHSVFVHAFTDLNVGDDLFIHKLFSSYPDIRFVLMARKPYREIFSRYRNVNVYDAESFPLNIAGKLRIDDRIRWRLSHECDYAVLIGGSIFEEFSTWKDQYQWYRELFDPDRLFFLGCSWGPVRTQTYQENMTALFAEVKDICFRDRYSFHTFSHLPQVRYAPDILFGFDWSACEGIREEKQVMISVVNCCSPNVGLEAYASDYRTFIAGLTEQFTESGYTVVYCSFWENDGDLAAAEEIRASLTPETRGKTSVVNYCGTNLEQILHLIAGSEYVVATRFHAMILGMVAGKKVLPLIYHSKLQHVLADLSFRGAYFDIRELPGDTSGIIPQITRGITAGERETLERLSSGHFEKLDQILR